MGQIDEIKEQIGWLKVVFGLLSAIIMGLIGWLAKNYNTANDWFVYLALAIVVISTIGIVYVNKTAYRKIKELKDL
jgi:membrane protein YdbS with pleckstrin-like domain